MKKIILLSLFTVSCSLFTIQAQSVLQFGGTNAYITFGTAPQLGLPEFTLECWFNKQAAGVTTTTGTGGVIALPLIAKGRAEADGTTQDMNYFLGINASNQLCADFEETTPSANPGLNHPVTGITTLSDNTWYHACATYDGTIWKLYLNGVLENTATVGVSPQSGSIQHASIGSALNSTGAASGFFYGMISEARVWDTALTSYEIIANINIPLTYPLPHLVSRWAMDEGSGTIINSVGSTVSTGTIIGTNYAWINTTVPFNINFLPSSPALVSPANNDSCQSTTTILSVTATDPDNTTLIVNFYGRPHVPAPPPFTIIGLPDTQHYCALLYGGTNEIYKAQTNWIVANRTALNIPFIAHFGDCVQNGDNSGNDIEWKRCDTAMKIIENPVTTTLADGMPYAMNVGNHDQSPTGSASGTSAFYNQYFGVNRFSSRPWYGGHYGSNYDNFYDLFSASGMDFVVLSLEYDVNATAAVLTWADSVLQAFPNRRGILVSHYILNVDTSFGAQGLAIYNALKSNPNLDLMLCGHVPGESHRTDVFNGNTCHSILADYQSRTNGGDGWLRTMEFNPGTNKINVKSYSPTLSQYETDASSQFSLNYDMTGTANPYMLIGTDTITSGGTASVQWNTLMADSTYEWYAVVSDSLGSTTGTVNTFSTFAPVVSFSFAGFNYYCENSGNISLPPGSPVGGTYSGTGVSGNTFDSNAQPAGIYPITYSYTSVTSGCTGTAMDSIIIIATSASAMNATACDSFAINSQTYNSSGTYTQTLTNAAGCDSTLTVNLTINTVDVSTTTGNASFMANSATGTYQWLDCNNGNSFIPGETNQLFTPLVNGDFAVIVTDNGCVDTSACINMFSVIVNEWTMDNEEWTISPNPSNGVFQINNRGNERSAIINLKILNLLGECVYQSETINNQSVIINCQLVKGIYFIKIETEDGRSANRKIIIQ